MKGCTPLAWPCNGQLISNNPLSAFPADLPFPLPFFFISCLFMSFLTRYRNSEPSLDTSAATIPRCRCHSYRKIKPLSFMVASLVYLQPCRHFDRRGVGSQSPFTFFWLREAYYEAFSHFMVLLNERDISVLFCKRSNIWSDSSGRQ